MTLYAQKANVVTVITEDRIDEFIAKGYKVMDASGTIIKDTAPDNLEDLKRAYISNTAEINNLKAENSRLREELTRAQKILEKKEAESNATEVVSEEIPAPRTRKSRTRRTEE